MVRLPSRKALESMKRADIQKLCKDYGVKANLKTEALIDLLLNVNTPPPKQDIQQSQPQPRAVSTRRSSRAGPSRTSSMIIHEVEEVEEVEAPQELGESEVEAEPAPTLNTPAADESRPRTRKAKETQLRLGVGRPKLAGGSGARAVTTSVSVSKGKRGKSSRTAKPSEAPIPEEVEEPDFETSTKSPPVELPVPLPDPSTLAIATDLPEKPSSNVDSGPAITPQINGISPSDLDKYIATAVQPLRQEISTLLTEFTQVKQQASQVDVLKGQIESLTTQLGEAQSQALEAIALAQELTEALKTPSNPRTPPPRSPRQEVPRAPHSISATTMAVIARPSSRNSDPLGDPPSPSTSRTPHDKSLLPHPGFALTALGKRHRDSTATNATGVIEEGDEDRLTREELATKVIRPMKKRPKITRYGSLTSDDPPSGPSRLTSYSPPPLPTASDEPRIPSFTVYQDPDTSDYVDPPPPTNHLPDFFEPGGSSRLPSTSSSHAAENHHPFDFSFLPYTSTPAHSNFVPPLPYPEAGQSPTPALIGRSGLAGRSGALQSLGLGRPGDGAQEAEGSFIDPAALTRRTSERQRGGSGDRTIIASSSQTPETNKPPQEPSKPTTMYGTELEGDTRFGEFGMEGVAGSQSLPNFWAAGRF